MLPVMNNTKWNELRVAMCKMKFPPAWTAFSKNGYRSVPDREWFYHLSEGGCGDILHLDILVEESQRNIIRVALQQIHLPGEETAEGFRIYGYGQPGQLIDYI